MTNSAVESRSTLEPQVWVGNKRPRAGKIEPVVPCDDQPGKKPDGGLWTSTLTERTDKGVKSPWTQKLHTDEWCNHDDPKVWVLYPEDNLNIYTISSAADLEDLLVEVETPGFFTEKEIPWQDIFPEYDAFHVTHEAYYDDLLYTMTEPKISTWNIPSTIWNGWHFEAIEYIGPISPQE